jgi:hypothetical protein
MALRYKPEGRGFDDVIGFLNLSNPSTRSMALGTTQPLTEMSTRNLFLIVVCILLRVSFLPSTQHLFNSHYMFRPQRVIFRCYKHMVLKLHHKSLCKRYNQ